jgi:hypothetical protein
MSLPDANIRSSSYFIAETQAHCAHCGRLARVLAIALPPDHEMLVDDEWEQVDASAFIFYVGSLPEVVSALLVERSPEFRQTHAVNPPESFWANHCPHCEAVFSDDQLHCEPGGFMPTSVSEAQAVSLSHIQHEFSALAAGYALEPEFFASMLER